VGAAYGTWQMQSLLLYLLPLSLDKHTLGVEFVIAEVHLPAANKPAHVFAKLVAVHGPLPTNNLAIDILNKRVRLAWYQPPSLEVGQRWQARVVLRRPRGMANPNGFDYAAWVMSQGLSATGYVRNNDAPILVSYDPPHGLAALKKHLQKLLATRADSQSAYRFFSALLLGEHHSLTPDDWRVLQATGTVHLMVISGLHVALVATLGFGLGALLVRLGLSVGVLPASAWPYRLVPALLGVSLASLYALLAGFAVPTQRALLAVVLLNIAWAVGVKYSPWRLFGLILLAVVAGEPMAATQPGFWLSFGAVLVLLLLLNGQQGRLHGGWQRVYMAVRLQCVLTLAMSVPLWLLGLPMSVLSPLANFIAVPLVSIVFVPALFAWIPLSFTPLGELWLSVLAICFDGLWWLFSQLASLPYAVLWPVQGLQGMGLLLGALVLAMLLMPVSLSMRAASACVLTLLVFGGKRLELPFELTVLDVGQGLAVVVHQPSYTLLFDTGPAFSERFNAGSQIIAPYLRYLGVGSSLWPSVQRHPFDLVISHADGDHSGGALPIVEQFSPVKLLVGEPVSGLPAPAQPCAQGQHWERQQASYQVLWPPADSQLEGNNASCVLLVTYQGVRFLVPGDVEIEAERAMVAANAVPQVDVLVAPHHGSNTSSSLEFLQAAAPKHIVVSAAYKSHYGHPHSKVMARYQAIGAQVWNTASDGAVRFSVNSVGFAAVSQRQLKPRLWY
jgi:competence protein ComEC